MAANQNEKIAGSGVSANTRTCVGRQTISVTTGAVSTLTVPAVEITNHVQEVAPV